MPCPRPVSLPSTYTAPAAGPPCDLVLDGRAVLPHMKPWSLYDFGYVTDWIGLSGSTGAVPWWTPLDWSARFFRPLASLAQNDLWNETC